MRSNAKKVMRRLMNKFEAVKREAPAILANEGQNYFNKAFQDKKWEHTAWPEVLRRIPGTRAYKYPKNIYLSRRTNPILIGKTRQLKNALNRASSSGYHNVNRIVWRITGQEGKYGYFHNEGIGQKKRKFMGASKGFGKALKIKFELLYHRRLK